MAIRLEKGQRINLEKGNGSKLTNICVGVNWGAITKKGCKYLRKTLYQIIIPVIQYNPVFRKFYLLKIAQGKGHRCAQGHCVRKLMRVIYHLLSTGTQFDPALLR